MNVGHDVNITDTDSLGARMPQSERTRPGGEKRRGAPPRPADPAPTRGAPKKAKFSVDAISLLQPALHRWPWLLLGLVGGAALGIGLGSALWHMSFAATAQMVRYDPPLAHDAFQPRPIETPTLLGRLGADPAFLRRVGQEMNPPMSAGEVLSHMAANPERNTGILNITASGRDAGAMTTLANVFARETLHYTQQLQAQEATEAIGYIEKDLREAEAQLAEAKKNLPEIAPGSSQADVSVAGTSLANPDHTTEQIQTAKDELTKLLAKYTDAHPLVRQQRATIAALEAEAATGISAAKVKAAKNESASASANGAAGPKRLVSRDEFEVALFRVREIESLRMQLLYRKQQLEIFKTNPPGGFKITVPASGETLAVRRPWVKIGLLGAFGALLGLTLTSGQILFREFVDTRLKTSEDVARVTGLPVLATLGDLRQMSMAARDDWAFRTWIALQDRLAFSPNHGLICGVTSSRAGDGRSTWIGLLAGAARKCGFRVLTIATKATADATINAHEDYDAAPPAADYGAPAAEPAPVNGHATPNASPLPVNGAAKVATAPMAGAKPATVSGAAVRVPPAAPRSAIEPLRGVSAESDFTAMTASVLFTPAQVTEKLMGPETDPLVHIPLPGWTWNLERRKQWQGALSVWRKIENVVILVELPPASQPEAVLLASNLPNILWLVESNKSEAAETQAQLQTLRHARCNLVGSVINRAMSTLTNGKFARWMSCFTLIFMLGLTSTHLVAQTAAPAENAAPEAFSVTSARPRAAWQKHLTLGPGDVLTVGLYGEPDLTMKEVPISPDGRFSYLEATDVVAAGLTVDELRDKLNDALGKFRREPQVIISPVAYKSKKYFVLGKIAKRGVYTLDRPITLLEAVARAQGMETGMSSDRTLIDLADLSHSFVARHGKKLPVDFERLFQQGDLSQNIALEPNDYIYFPASEMKEVYVLGAVVRPGPYAYTSVTGALGAIAARNGFDEYAWKKRVLVVRGSIQHPQTFVVDAEDVLSGKAPDMPLQPHDIVYVSKRPWWRAEDLLDDAASAFVTSAVVVWTGIHVDAELHK